MIKKIYHQLWADAIKYEKIKFGQIRNWKIFTISIISISQGVNLLTLFLWMKVGGYEFDIFYEVNLFSNRLIDSFISGVIIMFIPFIILNYMLIFRNKRYKIILDKYKYREGKIYVTYVISSLLIFILPIIIGKWIV